MPTALNSLLKSSSPLHLLTPSAIMSSNLSYAGNQYPMCCVFFPILLLDQDSDLIGVQSC